MSTGFLITSLSGTLKYINDIVNQHYLKRLYIYVSINKNQPNIKNNEWVSKRIIEMYSSSSYLYPNLDVRIILNEVKLQEERVTKIKDFNVDVIILPKNYDKQKILDWHSLQKNLCVIYSNESVDEVVDLKILPLKIYQNVVLGGTFDRLHNGHKILLSEALFRCSKKLTVGVTDESMITGKKLWELIEPSSVRAEQVETFVREVDSSIECEIVLISDMYGPTKSDPSLNMIVVSSETKKGALMINNVRQQNHLNELDIHEVDLANDFSSNKVSEAEEEKISSSNNRIRILGTYIRAVEPRPDLPLRPYLIGLTGGIASGKSSICEYLQTLGAGIVNCDKVAHTLYMPKTDVYYKLIKLFGNDIVSENGEINRTILGTIVFQNSEKLEQLNNLMWPEIYKAAIIEASRLYNNENKNIVIIEAAVLLRAKWHTKVHEVWATIIPQNEAIVRVMNRNNITQEEALLRINSQPQNSEIVRIANVVFCSLWSHDFTHKQVDTAWSAAQKKVSSAM